MRCLGRLSFLFVCCPVQDGPTYSAQRSTYTELFTDEGFYDDLTPTVLFAIIEDLEKLAPGDQLAHPK